MATTILKVVVVLAAVTGVAANTLMSQSAICKQPMVTVCQYLMSCEVFKGMGEGASGCGDDETSEEDIVAYVDTAVTDALNSPSNTTRCDGIKCVIKSAKDLECLDGEIIGRCLNVKNKAENACNVDCGAGSAAHRQAGDAAGSLLFAVFLGLATALRTSDM